MGALVAVALRWNWLTIQLAILIKNQFSEEYNLPFYSASKLTGIKVFGKKGFLLLWKIFIEISI